MNLKEHEQRFWSKVSVQSSNDCWNWLGSVVTSGYGYFSLSHEVNGLQRKYVMAHRFSMMLKLSTMDIPNMVLHQCDNKLCCNPKHLDLGDHSDNTKDAILRNRYKPNIGEAHGRAILTEEQVKWIRQEYPKGNYSHAELGRMFGVGATTIREVIKRFKWKHIG